MIMSYFHWINVENNLCSKGKVYDTCMSITIFTNFDHFYDFWISTDISAVYSQWGNVAHCMSFWPCLLFLVFWTCDLSKTAPLTSVKLKFCLSQMPGLSFLFSCNVVNPCPCLCVSAHAQMFCGRRGTPLFISFLFFFLSSTLWWFSSASKVRLWSTWSSCSGVTARTLREPSITRSARECTNS